MLASRSSTCASWRPTDDDAHETARRLAREEGIFGGITAGANVWTALRLARELGPGRRVVTLIVDSGLKYLQGGLYRSPSTSAAPRGT